MRRRTTVGKVPENEKQQKEDKSRQQQDIKSQEQGRHDALGRAIDKLDKKSVRLNRT